MKLSQINERILKKHPDLTKKEIKSIVSGVLSARAQKIRGAYILDFYVPFLGNIRTHRAKKTRRYIKNKVKDKKRKREQKRIKDFKKENLLW